MEREEQTATLYDFLYKDTSRLASYYAQVFGGKLASSERSDTVRNQEAKGGKLGVLPFISGEAGSSKETLSGFKSTIDPHDLIAVDLLSALIKAGRIREDVVAAGHGSLILAQGTIAFIDRHMIQMMSSALGAICSFPTPEPITGLEAIVALMKSIDLPSGFLLKDKNGLQIAGTIKESGMEEPIPTYYFKHGDSGLSDVFLIGIKEIAVAANLSTNTAMFQATAQASQALRDMVFSPDAIRVTPIAIFRKL